MGRGFKRHRLRLNRGIRWIGTPLKECGRDQNQDLGQVVSKLTDEDLDLIGGRRDRLEIKIDQRYGFAPSHVSKEIDDWVRWQAPKLARTRSRLSLPS